MKTPDELIESKVGDILIKDGQEWIMRPTTAALMQMYADQVKSAKTTKTYPIICPSCKGAGIVPNPNLTYTTTLTILCPACTGTGVVPCTETTESDYTSKDELYDENRNREEMETTKIETE